MPVGIHRPHDFSHPLCTIIYPTFIQTPVAVVVVVFLFVCLVGWLGFFGGVVCLFIFVVLLLFLLVFSVCVVVVAVVFGEVFVSF